MLDAVPALLRAVLWPLLGAALVLIANRLLPNWIRRLVASAAAVVSLITLWSMRSGTVARVEILWEPLHSFRMSPALHVISLSWLVGVILAWLTATTVLGVRGSESRSPAWQGLILIAFAGSLVMTMAANLLTLAMGSALLDMALIAMTLLAAGRAGRVAWRMVVPGVASTMFLFLSALQMDTLVGTGSLLAQNLPAEALMPVVIAGVLRSLVFPLHPRGLHTPENATFSLISAGVGIYLLARMHSLGIVLLEPQWIAAIGCVALAVGGLLAWTASAGPGSQPDPSSPAHGGLRADSQPIQSQGRSIALAMAWPGMAIHQTGLAIAFLAIVGAATPWPLISLTLALGMLIIWWDSVLAGTATSAPGWLTRQIEVGWAQAQTYVTQHLSALAQGRGQRLVRYAATLLPAIALASLVGAPLTTGARARWPLYASLFREGRTSIWIAVLIADTFLTASLCLVLRSMLKRQGARRPTPAAGVAMISVAVPIIALGIAPQVLDLEPASVAEIPTLGVGLLYVLPWLLGGWLAYSGILLGNYADLLGRILALDWLFRALDWMAHRLADAIYWLGQVGEGEGWWGWALIILALGAMLLTIR